MSKVESDNKITAMGRVAILERDQNSARLAINDTTETAPTGNEVLVQNHVVGLNVLDVITRSQLINGLFKDNRIVVGYSGVGTIVSMGTEVSGFMQGQKIAYLLPTAGACATHCKVPARYIAAVPQNLPEKMVAATFLHAMLAHALTARTFIVSTLSNVLVHDITSTTGQIIARFAKNRKPHMLIGTVPSSQQAKEAQEYDVCNHIVNYNSENFASEVAKLTNKTGINVVYDGIGSKFITHKSIEVLDLFGMLILYNMSIFEIQQMPTLELAQKSLYMSCPSVFDYKSIREEFVLTADEIFSLIADGVLSMSYIEYKMAGLQEALNTIANQKSPDAIIITM